MYVHCMFLRDKGFLYLVNELEQHGVKNSASVSPSRFLLTGWKGTEISRVKRNQKKYKVKFLLGNEAHRA